MCFVFLALFYHYIRRILEKKKCCWHNVRLWLSTIHSRFFQSRYLADALWYSSTSSLLLIKRLVVGAVMKLVMTEEDAYAIIVAVQRHLTTGTIFIPFTYLFSGHWQIVCTRLVCGCNSFSGYLFFVPYRSPNGHSLGAAHHPYSQHRNPGIQITHVIRHDDDGGIGIIQYFSNDRNMSCRQFYDSAFSAGKKWLHCRNAP